MSKKLPFFSIIIPTYHRQTALKNCLQAIVELTYPRELFEVIVVDDGSPCSPKQLIHQFSDLQITLIHQKNQGPGAARNTGSQVAKGDFLVFTDDDCIPDKHWLCNLAKHFHNTDQYLVGGKTINLLTDNIYSSMSQIIVDIVYQHYNQNPQNAKFFASNNFALSACHFRDLSGFNSQLATAEDREFCDRWLFHGYKMIYDPQIKVYHAHKLSFIKFCKQHFCYGRGAFHFHRIRSSRKSGTIAKEMKFHLNIKNWLFYPLQQKKKYVFTYIFLLVVWQIANAAGFGYQAICHLGGYSSYSYRDKL